MKKFYLSKTFWVNIFMAIAIAVPQSNAFIMQYFTEAGIGWGLLNTLLRFWTKDEITIK